MKYIVISSFKDLTDNEFEYIVGDQFPREGRTIDEIPKERLEQLTTKNNRKGRILIKGIEMEEPKTEKENTIEKVEAEPKDIAEDSKEEKETAKQTTKTKK